MKTPLYLTTFLALAVFAGCKKDSVSLDTFVEGRILTYGTDQKVSNKQFKINLYSESGGSGLGVGETLIQESQTDTNGYFSFEFTASNERTRFYLRVLDGAPMHHPRYGVQYFLETGVRQKKDIYFNPHAWLNLHIKNVNPQPGDRIRLSRGGGVFYDFSGAVDEQKLELRHGNADHIISYSVLRNSDVNQYFDTVYLTAFDTTYHLLEY